MGHGGAAGRALRRGHLLAAHGAPELRLPDLSAEHFIDTFRTYYGPVRKAFEALDTAGQDALAKDLTELIHAWNASGDGTAVLPSEYLEVVAFRR